MVTPSSRRTLTGYPPPVSLAHPGATPAPDIRNDPIDAEVLQQYLKCLQSKTGLIPIKRAREKAGPEAPIQIFAHHLIDQLSINAERDARGDECGNTDAGEIARWHREWVDDACIPTQETTSFCPRLEARAESATDEGLRRWNGLAHLRLDDAGVYVRRGRTTGPHDYEVRQTGDGWTLVEHGLPTSDRERTNHLIHHAAEAVFRCAEDLGRATRDIPTTRAELFDNAEQEAEAHNRTAG